MLFQSPRACSTRMTAAETEAKPGRAGNRQVQELELVGRLRPEQEAKSSQMTAGWAPGAAATKARIQAQSGSWKASRNPPLRPPCRQPERCQQRAHRTAWVRIPALPPGRLHDLRLGNLSASVSSSVKNYQLHGVAVRTWCKGFETRPNTQLVLDSK